MNDELLKENKLLKDQIEKLLNERKFGLVWENTIEDNETADYTVILDKELSINLTADTAEHLFFEGDNLLSLRELQKTHKEKIDVIYIDPPYNTGNKFVYSDKLVDKEDIFSHSKWLSFMSKRLELARELLSDDGVIFVSIDDREQAQLKLLMDKIFGEKNFIENFLWERTTHYGRQSKNTYVNAEYILCYSKKLYKNSGEMKRLLVDDVQEVFEDAPLYNNSNNLQTLKFDPDTVKFNLVDGVYESFKTDKYELLNDVIIKNRTNVNEFRMKFRSRWSQKKLMEQNKLGGYPLIKSKQFAVRYVYGNREPHYKSVLKTLNTSYGNNQEASKLLNNILGEGIFEYPKPITLIKYLIRIVYGNKNITILDFFAGSGTTGHAVMELNKEDGGNRQFILCTNNEVSEEKEREYLAEQGYIEKPHKRLHTKYKEEYPEQYKTFLNSEDYQSLGIARSVTRERLKRVIEGYTTPKGKEVEGLVNNKVKHYTIERKIQLETKNKIFSK